MALARRRGRLNSPLVHSVTSVNRPVSRSVSSVICLAVRRAAVRSPAASARKVSRICVNRSNLLVATAGVFPRGWVAERLREEGAIGWDGDSASETVDDGGGESGGVNDVAGSSCSGFGLGGRDLGRRTAM